MAAEGDNVADADIQLWLQSVGVESLCQLEVLSFVHRHPITFLPPEHLARLLGYRTDSVVDALHSLSTLQLLTWSAQSRAGYSYLFIVPSVPCRAGAVERLLALSAQRSGRLLLRKHLALRVRTLQEDFETVGRFLDDADANLQKIALLFGTTSETLH